MARENISQADQEIMDANLARMARENTSLGRQCRVMVYSMKINEMTELTNVLLVSHGLDHFLDVERKLRKLRNEARPYEEEMDDYRGLDSTTGTKNEKLQRLLYQVDYFYDDH
ncbi:hypothetical protein FRACYDRAFT_221577 [Fragilariopsis cylindrus CCMP1102]|uniref:Uncharacterized protein n=1 Tax=Fragilariopsis cylindrus CCMP1102 TaxID=635003 RepID=A0A1E7ELS2_9STRA|nr:hypothetical protein FRACYDRAFT_221577 [Fragilariopsis cylindrus CCMP1102]|eukprot:OEU06872.1 hypothetical protein FRACYDRAFT_221577 [Fragilariopsis cylindrus CCMP1102]